MFNVVRVNSRQALNVEPLGTKRKFWYRDDRRRMLFKAEERGTGEDWAEKIACELCELLGLPHVQYELAVESDGNTPGVVCETCAPPPTLLALGNQLLLAIDESYPGAEDRRYKVREHTIDAVADALRLLTPPPAPWSDRLAPPIESSLDVFVGYVMLDAWIANQDRHHENWGMLFTNDGFHLAPTFDHGASMARNLSDDERHERLTTNDRRRQIPAFAARARSAFYPDRTASRPFGTVQAWEAFANLAPRGAGEWLARLATIDQDTIRALLEEVPPRRMSRVCRDFTAELLAENQRRLLATSEQ
jgi:hypothetical protein